MKNHFHVFLPAPVPQAQANRAALKSAVFNDKNGNLRFLRSFRMTRLKSVCSKFITLLFLFSLAACQPASTKFTNTPSTQAASTPQAASVPDVPSLLGVKEETLKGLTIQVWHPWFGVEANLFESQAQAFNQTNPYGIIVQSTSQIDYNELFQSVTAVLPTPNRPQVVIGLPEHALAWNADNYVTDLNNYVNDPKYGFSDSDVKDFPSAFWNQDSIGGHRLGLPAERSARFLLYDVTWARQLGFDVAPTTADEFKTQACAAHAALLNDKDRSNDAMGGWLVDAQSMTALSWLTAFGGGALDGNNYRFLTPNNIAAFTFVKELFDAGCAWSLPDSSGAFDAFANRKALFSTASLEDLSDQSRAFSAANNSDEWTVLAFPGTVQSGLIIYGSSYIILNSTAEQQLASWLFVRWMLSSENQAKWVQVTDLFPLRASSLDLLKDYGDSHPQWGAAIALLPSAEIQPQLASWRTVRIMLGDGFDNMFRTELNNQPVVISNQPAAILQQMDTIAHDLAK